MHAGSTMARPTALFLTIIASLTLGLAVLSAADNWPQFRGPHSGVIADDPALPDSWGVKENIAWKVDVPGVGWGSPIVWDDYLFVTSVISDEPRPKPTLDQEAVMAPHTGGVMQQKPLSTPYRWVLYAIDFKTGKVRWQRDLRKGIPASTKHSKNTYASETPVTDGKRVYVFHASAGLFAVDFQGRIVWSRDVALPEPKTDVVTTGSAILARGQVPKTLAASYFIGLGQAASPALYQNRIFTVADHESHQWFLAAYDTRTGDELWRVNEGKSGEAYGWSTPFVWESGSRTEIITAGNNRVRSYDPDGKLLWELKGMSLNTTPTPFAAHGLLYVSSGYAGDTFRPAYAIRPGANGDISLKPGEASNQYVAWFQPSMASYMPSALVYGDHLYTLYSQGFLTCHEAKTGKQIYGRQRLGMDAGGFTASPWAYNGEIFAASEDGDTYVLKAGPEYKLLHKNSLGEAILATPAIVRGSLIVRTVSSLYRIAKTAK